MPHLNVFLALPGEVRTTPKSAAAKRGWRKGEKTWQVVMTDNFSRECFEELYSEHDGEVAFKQLILLDKGLVDIIFSDAPMQISLDSLEYIEEQVFTHFIKKLANSTCYSASFPKLQFTDAQREALAKKGLVLLNKNQISNHSNVRRRDARADGNRIRKR
jgi:hypothetical protein